MTKKLAESYKKAYGFWEVTTEGDFFCWGPI